MAFCNIRVTACIVFSLCIFLQDVSSQKCIKGVKKVDIIERGYRSPVVVRAKVTVATRVNQTAEVTYVFGTKTGGLAVGDSIVFGPVKKAKGCPRMKKNSEFILFLENKEPGSNFYKIKYDPVSKVNQAKKLKKVLCAGCVKAPKFKQSDVQKKVKEGKAFTFNCRVSGNPKPKTVFLKDLKQLPPRTKGMTIKNKKKGGGGRLKIKKVKPSHAGVYTCQASNFAGNASLSYTLIVKGASNSTTTTTATTTTTTTTSTTVTASPAVSSTTSEMCIPCKKRDSRYCFYGGRCCYLPEANETYCRCQTGYYGQRCEKKSLPDYGPIGSEKKAIEARYHRQTVAIMGVCIALLLVILICYIVYCKFKKSRSHILKDIQKQYCHVNGREADREEERPIAHANSDGIVGGDSNESAVNLTGYRSTNLTEPSYASQPLAFAQRPQTYDDVIPVLGGAATESQPLVGHHDHTAYVKREEAKQGNGRRKRKNGVAVENRGYGKQSNTTSDGDMSVKGGRRIDELKRNRDSIISSSSSVSSHPELRKPAIPIDERLASMGVHIPPAYGDYPDSGPHQEQPSHAVMRGMEQPQMLPSFAGAESNHSPQTFQNRECAISSPSSASRLTDVESEGKVEDFSNIHPTTKPDSSTFSDYLPKPDQNTSMPSLASQESSSGQMSPRGKLQYRENIQPAPYSYYEQNQEKQLHSPSAYHHSDESHVVSSEMPGTSASFYDNQRQSQPSSPRQYPNSLGMGMPYHHAPVTVASARTHHLPLLTKEKADEQPNSQNGFFAGSAVSLTSSSSDESNETERNRNSHKIEV